MRLKNPNGAGLPASGVPGAETALPDFDDTLKRLVDRIAKILQAEKCVFLLYEPVTATLVASEPAQGFAREQLLRLERRVTDDGYSSEVFRSNVPVILYDAARDPRAVAEGLTEMGIRNGIAVPLIIERRDDENRVLDRSTVGVLLVFNKRHGSKFTDDDVPLLKSLANQGAAIIAQAQVYREIVREKHELIHTIDSLYAGLLMVANNGRLLQINRSARNILGIQPDVSLVGLPFSAVIPNDTIRNVLRRALTNQSGESVEEIVLDGEWLGEGPRVYQVQCAPVMDAADLPAGVVAIFNDITEFRNIERMKTAFISTVSHELRTPLTSIKGFIATLLADTEHAYDEPTRQEFYTIIDTECDRLTRLINDLLDVSRIEQGRALQMNWEWVDLPALVEKVLNTQRMYAHNHVLESHFVEAFPLIEADRDKLDQILTNLVNNAIKYSPHGGRVQVTGRFADWDRTKAAIDVDDEGIGISGEHLPKLFDRFYRVDNRDNRDIGGTGIGLALVKSLTEAHGGVVSVRSEVGKGTSFTIVLPLKQDSPSREVYDA